MRPEFFTNQYGFIVDYLAEWMREMRKRNFGDAINKYFKLGRDLNQRDTIAVKHTVSGLLKLLYPNEEYDKEAVRRCLAYALEARRRVKEQLKLLPPRSWTRARPEPDILGIRNGREPQLDNTRLVPWIRDFRFAFPEQADATPVSRLQAVFLIADTPAP